MDCPFCVGNLPKAVGQAIYRRYRLPPVYVLGAMVEVVRVGILQRRNYISTFAHRVASSFALPKWCDFPPNVDRCLYRHFSVLLVVEEMRARLNADGQLSAANVRYDRFRAIIARVRYRRLRTNECRGFVVYANHFDVECCLGGVSSHFPEGRRLGCDIQNGVESVFERFVLT